MVRKLLCGLTVAAALVFVVGCSSSSSAPAGKSDAERKADQDKMKGMMPGGGAAPSAK